MLDWHSGMDLVVTKKLDNVLVFLVSQDPDDIQKVLSRVSQWSLSNNLWFVIGKNANLEKTFDFLFKDNANQRQLNLQAQLYFINDCSGEREGCNHTITEIFGNAKEDPTFQVS